jgi:hypothetical protein
MTSSGTYTFDPNLGELVLYAYNIAGLRNTSLTQEHFEAARMAANMMLASWSNQGVNLWAVDLQTVPLVAGQATYTVPDNTVVMLDAYIQNTSSGSNPTDRIILSISRTEYASYPNKEQQGFPTVFWYDRLLSPTVTLWPVPDGVSAQTLKYYRLVQLQDSAYTGGQTVNIPYLWMEAFADGLAYRLAKIWNQAAAITLKAVADESYKIAADQNIETASQYISPQITGYYRP